MNTSTGKIVERDRIVHEIVYPHPRQQVWEALTDRQRLSDWLMETDFEPRLGCHFVFLDHTVEADSTGVIECEIVALAPPRRLAYTWASPPKLHPTLVSWTLDELETGTRVQLVHSGFAAGGEAGLTIRDYLEWGWGGLLHEELLDHLNGLMTPARPRR